MSTKSVKITTLSYLEAGDLQGAAQSLLPFLQSKIGEEIDPDLEFALCAVLLASIAQSDSPPLSK